MKCFGSKDIEYLTEVIESQSLWRGLDDNSFCSRFEDAFAKHLGRKYVLGVSSGTNAEEVALLAFLNDIDRNTYQNSGQRQQNN